MLKKYSVLRGFVILCVGLLVFCLPPLQAQGFRDLEQGESPVRCILQSGTLRRCRDAYP